MLREIVSDLREIIRQDPRRKVKTAEQYVMFIQTREQELQELTQTQGAIDGRLLARRKRIELEEEDDTYFPHRIQDMTPFRRTVLSVPISGWEVKAAQRIISFEGPDSRNYFPAIDLLIKANKEGRNTQWVDSPTYLSSHGQNVLLLGDSIDNLNLLRNRRPFDIAYDHRPHR